MDQKYILPLSFCLRFNSTSFLNDTYMASFQKKKNSYCVVLDVKHLLLVLKVTNSNIVSSYNVTGSLYKAQERILAIRMTNLCLLAILVSCKGVVAYNPNSSGILELVHPCRITTLF